MILYLSIRTNIKTGRFGWGVNIPEIAGKHSGFSLEHREAGETSGHGRGASSRKGKNVPIPVGIKRFFDFVYHLTTHLDDQARVKKASKRNLPC